MALDVFPSGPRRPSHRTAPKSDNEGVQAFLEEIGAAAADASRALRLTASHFQADTATLHELGSDGMLHLKAWTGLPDHLLPHVQTIPVGKGIAGLAVERKEPVNLCNLQSDTSGAARPRALDTGVKGSICVPLLAGDKAVGALGIGTKHEREFQAGEIETLMDVGRILASERWGAARKG